MLYCHAVEPTGHESNRMDDPPSHPAFNKKGYVFSGEPGVDLAELVDDMFENVAGSFVEERLQCGKVSALLKDAL